MVVKAANSSMTGLAVLAGMLVLSLAMLAGERNYQSIVDRNPFGLKPPAPPAPPPDPAANKPPPVSNINMTGITTDLDNKRVWLIANVAGKQPPNQFYSLAEGDKQDDIEVVSIDEQSETVKILNAGTPLTLTFATHGVKGKPSGAAMAGAPAGTPPPGGIPAPTGVPGAPNSPAAGPVVIGRGGVVLNNNTPAPTAASTFITQPTGSTGVPGAGTDSTFTGGARVIPSRSLRTQTATSQAADQTLPAEAQYLMMNAQKIEASRRGINLPPLPPIPGAPPDSAPPTP